MGTIENFIQEKNLLGWLIHHQYKILKIYEREFESWYIVETFESADLNGAITTDFHQIKGFDVTKFFGSNLITLSKEIFFNKLESHIGDSTSISISFSTKLKWMMYE